MAIHVNIDEAAARFSELYDAAVRGEEVIVQIDGQPTVRLIPLPEVLEA